MSESINNVDAQQVANVQVLNLDDTGYGPEGTHTRRQWRDECLQNLLAGGASFEVWQQTKLDKKRKHNPEKDFSYVVEYADGRREMQKLYAPPWVLDFTGQTFEQAPELVNSRFLIDAYFNASKFLHGARFDNTKFEMAARFEATIFIGRTSFGGVTFTRDAAFSFVTFIKQAGFHRATFMRESGFNNSLFFSDAVFSNANFNGNAWFQNTVFSEAAHFNNVAFTGAAKLENVTFMGNGSFQSARFAMHAFFKRSVFNQGAGFQGAEFASTTDFENAQFDNVGHFERAKFLGNIPTFRGCKIDSTRLEFSADEYFTQQDFTEDAIKNISFLKRLADEHGQTDQALNFNAMELRAKCKKACQELEVEDVWLKIFHFWPLGKLTYLSYLLDGKFWFFVFTWLYEAVSDFGRSFTRPLSVLIGLIAITYLFGVVSAFENSPSKITHSRKPIFAELSRIYINQQDVSKEKFIPLSAYRAATEYSLYRSGNFLDFTDDDKTTASVNVRLFGSEIEPWWARIFGLFKGIVTTILLFLIALGLRNKYRVS